MVYALNVTATYIAILAGCAAVGLLALIGAIFAVVKIVKYKKADRQEPVSKPAPAQQALTMPERPQLPAPSEEPKEADEPVAEETTVEKPADEPVAETAAEEEPAVRETVEEAVEEAESERKEEPVKETVEADDADEADEDSFDEDAVQTEIPDASQRVVPEGKILVKVRYNRSYTARLIQSQDVLKGYYDEVKSELMRYGVTPRISWKHETFRKGRKLLARFAVRGKTLGVYLALNPAEFENTKYKVEDVSSVKKNADVPSLYRIKNDRRCRYIKEIIAKLMAENGVEAGEELHENYSAQYPYEELEPLIEKKLVKLLPWKEFAAGSEVGLIAVSKDDIPAEIFMGEVSVDEAEDMFVGGSVDVLVESSAKVSDKTKKDIINIDTLGKYFHSGETVTVEEIKKRVPDFGKKVTYLKVLARGKLDKALTVEADDFSPAAIKMIILTGGKVIRKKANNV